MHRLQLNIQKPDDPHPRQIVAGHFPFQIGRALNNDLSLPAPSISGNHLLLDCDAQGAIIATDLGSTNGTVHGDEPLSPHQPHRLQLPTSLRLGEVHIEIRSPQDDEPRFTMAESATELREMVDDTLRKESSDDSRPLFEILSGPGCGQRFHLEVDGPKMVIGTGDDAHIHLDVSDLPSRLATVFWRDMHCWIDAETPDLKYRGAPLERQRRLRSGDRFTVGVVELLYYDPLEDTLASIDPEHWAKENGPDKKPPPPDDAEEDDPQGDPEVCISDDDADEERAPEPSAKNDHSPDRLGAVELALLAMSIFFFVGAIALLIVFFTW